jgi:dehydrogenase/reductase SDR family protein 1
MVPRKTGLIINVSSFGGVRYLFNVAYGIGKAAVDRMAADCGVELKKHNVCMLSLYPGAVKTELVQNILKNEQQAAKSANGVAVCDVLFDKKQCYNLLYLIFHA